MRPTRAPRLAQTRFVEQCTRWHPERVCHANQSTKRDEVLSPLDSSQGHDVESETFSSRFLRPLELSTQLDDAPTDVAHDAIRPLHRSNARSLDVL
jgi:hypothetical protein